MRTLKIAVSALTLCVVLGGTVSAAVFPSMPKVPHSTHVAHAHGASHSHKHK
jgi:hypothetical protein